LDFAFERCEGEDEDFELDEEGCEDDEEGWLCVDDLEEVLDEDFRMGKKGSTIGAK
jgi:hypothetical protein